MHISTLNLNFDFFHLDENTKMLKFRNFAIIAVSVMLYESSRRKPGWRFTAGFKYGVSCELVSRRPRKDLLEFFASVLRISRYLTFVWNMLIFPIKFNAFRIGPPGQILKAIGLKRQNTPVKTHKNCPSHRFFSIHPKLNTKLLRAVTHHVSGSLYD